MWLAFCWLKRYPSPKFQWSAADPLQFVKVDEEVNDRLCVDRCSVQPQRNLSHIPGMAEIRNTVPALGRPPVLVVPKTFPRLSRTTQN